MTNKGCMIKHKHLRNSILKPLEKIFCRHRDRLGTVTRLNESRSNFRLQFLIRCLDVFTLKRTKWKYRALFKINNSTKRSQSWLTFLANLNFNSIKIKQMNLIIIQMKSKKLTRSYSKVTD